MHASRGEGCKVDGEEEVDEGAPAANRLENHTGRHYVECVALQAPAQGLPGSKNEPREGAQRPTPITWELCLNAAYD